jgi:hypothetical protein
MPVSTQASGPQPSAEQRDFVWDVSHLGKPVRFKDDDDSKWHYHLDALTFDSGNGGIRATLVTVVPSPRPGLVGHYELESIELA